MSKLRVLDLFSGIGGFSLGLERTGGFETVAFCEIEPFPRRVLAKHWPEVPCYDDVRTLTAERLAADGIGVDIICGGFPCQDISIAGKGAGIEGESSGLWREYARLIGEIRPRYVVVENVERLRTAGLPDVLGKMAALGLYAEWHCIPAYYVGLPQARDRIWIVAHPMFEGETRWRPGWLGRWIASEGQTGRHGWPRDEAADVQLRPEPALDRVAYGLPDQVHRINALGNAVVPQIPELIGRAILAAESERRSIAA